MYKKRYQRVQDDKTRLNKEGNEIDFKDVFNPAIGKNFLRKKLKYSNRLSDSQKTELLYYQPYENSNSTLQSAIENEANGYMKNYFVNAYEGIDKIFQHDGILKQYYVVDDGVYEEYVPVENTQNNKSKPENPKIKITCNDKYITSNIDSLSPQIGSDRNDCKSKNHYYFNSETDKDDMIEKFINQSNLPVQLESENVFCKEDSDLSGSFDIKKYYHKINTLLKTTSNEDTTVDSIKDSIEVFKTKTVAVQTDPVYIIHDAMQKNHSTQTDSIRYPRKMLRSQFLQNRASQCDNFDIIKSTHFKTILKYSQYIILAGVVCNMIRMSCYKSIPFFQK